MSIVSLRTSENIDAGDAVYASGAGLANKGDALNQDRASLVGVALTSGSPGSLIQVISDSVYTSTSTFVPGEIQYLSTTRGKYDTYDVVSSGIGLTDAEGLYVTHVGRAITTNKINIELTRPVFVENPVAIFMLEDSGSPIIDAILQEDGSTIKLESST